MEILESRRLTPQRLPDPMLRGTHDLWLLRRGEGDMPAFSRFDLMHLPFAALSHSLLIDVDGEGYTFRYCGPAMARLCTERLPGRRVASLGRDKAAHLKLAYDEVVEARAPLAETVAMIDEGRQYRKTVLRLPFAEDSCRVDRILVAATYRMAAAA